MPVPCVSTPNLRVVDISPTYNKWQANRYSAYAFYGLIVWTLLFAPARSLDRLLGDALSSQTIFIIPVVWLAAIVCAWELRGRSVVVAGTAVALSLLASWACKPRDTYYPGASDGYEGALGLLLLGLLVLVNTHYNLTQVPDISPEFEQAMKRFAELPPEQEHRQRTLKALCVRYGPRVVQIALILSAVPLVLLSRGPYEDWLPRLTQGVVSVCAFLAFRWRGKVSQLPAADLLKVDSRPPILFLRSFRDESKMTFGAGETVEEILARNCSRIGPPIGLQDPGLFQYPGSARLNVGDDWPQFVREFIPQCRFVVAQVGETPALLWEIQQVRALESLSRLILVFPVVAPDLQDRRWAATLQALGRSAEGIVPDANAPHARVPALICIFGADGTPMLVVGPQTTPTAYQTAIQFALGHLAADAPTVR